MALEIQSAAQALAAPGTPAEVLAAARRARAAAHAAEAEVLAAAVAWAHLHRVETLAEAATWPAGHGQDTGIALAGEGAPLVGEFAVAELASVLGLSVGSGRNLLAHALELAHRLPRLWARVQDGSLPPWRARRIAEETLVLSAEAAGWVDAQVAAHAHRVGPAQTDRLVEEAIARFMPGYAAERRERAAEARFLDVEHDQVSFAGTSRVIGELDLADALDLDAAVRHGADQLRAAGSMDPLDVRRAAALGSLARGEGPLRLPTSGTEPPTEPQTGPRRQAPRQGPRAPQSCSPAPIAVGGARWCSTCTCPPTGSVTRVRRRGWRAPGGSWSPPVRSPSGAAGPTPRRSASGPWWTWPRR